MNHSHIGNWCNMDTLLLSYNNLKNELKKTSIDNLKIKEKLKSFLEIFEVVFDYDWEHTSEMINIKKNNIDSFLSLKNKNIQKWKERNDLLDSYNVAKNI